MVDGLNFRMQDWDSFARVRLETSSTPLSLDVIRRADFPTWSLLYRPEMDERPKPPQSCGRNSRDGSADFAKPNQLFSDLVAIGSRDDSIQDRGKY